MRSPLTLKAFSYSMNSTETLKLQWGHHSSTEHAINYEWLWQKEYKGQTLFSLLLCMPFAILSLVIDLWVTLFKSEGNQTQTCFFHPYFLCFWPYFVPDTAGNVWWSCRYTVCHARFFMLSPNQFGCVKCVCCVRVCVSVFTHQRV